jgi:hypothetical protein
MDREALIKNVRDAIQAATDNGYDTSKYTNEELAGDLKAYEYSVEDETFEDILEAVDSIRGGAK